jgi:hypothetical protein
MSLTTERICDILEVVQKYCDDCGYDDGYPDLQLRDLDYLADELDMTFEQLIGILREDM